MEHYKKYKEINNQLFDGLIDRFTDEHQIVGQSQRSHEKRMDKVTELGSFHDKKILDVGCGAGAYLSYLKMKGIKADYYGYDINEKMLELARKNYPSDSDKFSKIDILEERLNENFNFCVSVGPLNLFLDEESNYAMTFRLMDKMFEYSATGFALSMTSVLSRKKNADTFYYDPNRIVSHISGYCNNFRLDHSYLPHDFTIFCYKNDFYS